MIIYSNHHISINTTNIEKSINFYKLLCFEERYRYADDRVTIVHLFNQSLMIELFHYSNAPPIKTIKNDMQHCDIIGLEHFSFSVDDIQEAFNELKQFSVCNISNGRTGIDYFFIIDPDGNRIEIVKDTRLLL